MVINQQNGIALAAIGNHCRGSNKPWNVAECRPNDSLGLMISTSTKSSIGVSHDGSNHSDNKPIDSLETSNRNNSELSITRSSIDSQPAAFPYLTMHFEPHSTGRSQDPVHQPVHSAATEGSNGFSPFHFESATFPHIAAPLPTNISNSDPRVSPAFSYARSATPEDEFQDCLAPEFQDCLEPDPAMLDASLPALSIACDSMQSAPLALDATPLSDPILPSSAIGRLSVLHSSSIAAHGPSGQGPLAADPVPHSSSSNGGGGGGGGTPPAARGDAGWCVQLLPGPADIPRREDGGASSGTAQSSARHTAAHSPTAAAPPATAAAAGADPAAAADAAARHAPRGPEPAPSAMLGPSSGRPPPTPPLRPAVPLRLDPVPPPAGVRPPGAGAPAQAQSREAAAAAAAAAAGGGGGVGGGGMLLPTRTGGWLALLLVLAAAAAAAAAARARGIGAARLRPQP